MAVTVNAQRHIIGTSLLDYDLKGLSTDTKPTTVNGEPIAVNSIFFELNTGDFYYFDGENWAKVGA